MRLCALLGTDAAGAGVRLIPAAYVKPFVRRNKNDARDAEAICAALGHRTCGPLRSRTSSSKRRARLEGTRELLMKQHTQLRNCVRGQLASVRASSPRRGAHATAFKNSLRNRAVHT